MGIHGGQLCVYKKGKHKFEVISKQGQILKFRDGKVGVNSVLLVDQVFTNSVRGDVANAVDLSQVFGTDDIIKCCEEIVKNGELQYSAQERKAFVDEKTKEIVYYINKNYANPKTKLPHPADRISHCMKECKIRVDPKADTRRMAEDALKKMRGKLMFAKAVSMRAKLTIKHQHVGQCTNLIHKVATVIHEEWTGTGCVFTVELSKADMNSLQVALMKPTNGDYEITFLDDSGNAVGAASDCDNDSKNKKGKKGKKKKDKKKKKQSNNNNEEEKAMDNVDGKNKKNKKKKKKKSAQ